jgi:hypothetical protein
MYRFRVAACKRRQIRRRNDDASQDGIEEIESSNRSRADEVEERAFYAKVGERLMQALEYSICALLLVAVCPT